LTVETIADRRHVPEKFLVHVLLQLKRADLVRSMRGAKGGYLLARPPEEVSLLDIIRAVDGPVLYPLPVQEPGSEDLTPAWREVVKGIEGVLQATTVQDILDRAARSSMYYI
jgi:Rrf2 family protein